METLTKAKIIENLFESVGLSKNESAEVIFTMLKIILKTLSEGKQMKISNFGTFKLRKKNQELVEIPKLCKSLKFQQEKLSHLNPPVYL